MQFCSSSELSKQSSSPSQTQALGMHLKFLQVKSHGFGQACMGGSAAGSAMHVLLSGANLSPYGHPHLRWNSIRNGNMFEEI